MRFKDEIDYVTPILNVMDRGDYDAARAMLNIVPAHLRQEVRMTIAARRQAIL